MKIAVCSDLHLEFGRLDLFNAEKADVLVLSGDILIAEDLDRFPENRNDAPPIESHRYINSTIYRDFLEQVNSEFPKVIYVAGNHEFYGGKWKKSLDVLRSYMENYANIFFLEKESIKIDDITFIGGTLWTDMNKYDPITMGTIRDMMNDYRTVTNDEKDYTKLKPADTVLRHRETLNYIKSVITEKPDEKFVVVGHHAPTKLSVKPRYENDFLMNGAYSSDLSEFILDHPQIKLWTHGHTHDEFDYVIGNTRVVCNPRGYIRYEQRAMDFTLKYVDVV